MQAFDLNEIRISKSEIQMSQCSKQKPSLHGFGHLNLDHWRLPFDVARGGESFDVAQDPEGLEGLVEPLWAVSPSALLRTVSLSNGLSNGAPAGLSLPVPHKNKGSPEVGMRRGHDI